MQVLGLFDQLADAAFENDMEEAILLSKMDFEQQKLLQEVPESPKGKKPSKKKDKPHTLSIDEFNQLGPADVSLTPILSHSHTDLEFGSSADIRICGISSNATTRVGQFC